MSLIILLGIISFTNITIPAFAQQTQGKGINWLEICRNPLVDAMITEPCDTLTTPDGYTLTPQGQHVLECIGGGTLAVITGHPELLNLKSAVGCGGNSGSSSPYGSTQNSPYGSSNNNDPLGNNLPGY